MACEYLPHEPQITMVTMHRPEESEARKLTLLSKQRYAQKHHYRLIELDWEVVASHPDYAGCKLCAKILAMLEVLPQLEWMVWMDGDVLIHNHNRRLYDLLDARFAVQVPRFLPRPVCLCLFGFMFFCF